MVLKRKIYSSRVRGQIFVSLRFKQARNYLLSLVGLLVFLSTGSGEENRERSIEKSQGLEYFHRGELLMKSGNLQEALDSYNYALELFQRGDSKFLEAETLSQLGVIHRRLGRSQLSLEFQLKALELYNQLDKTREKAITLRRIGVVYRSLGELAKSLEAQREALILMEKLGDLEGIADSRMNMSVIYTSLGKLREALKIQEEALQVYRTLQRSDKIAFALGNLGLTRLLLGNFQEALDDQYRSLDIKHQLGDIHGESNSRVNLGLTYTSLGDYSKALDQYWKALDLYRKLGNKQGEAVTLSSLGDLFGELGNLSRAETYYLSSLKLREEIQDKAGRAIILKNLASLYRKQGSLTRAKGYFQEALQLAEEIPLLLNQGDIYQEIGLILQTEGETSSALEALEKALTLYEKAEYSLGVINVLGHLGDIYITIGNFEKSLFVYQRGLKLAQQEQSLYIQAHLLHRLGLLYEKMNRPKLALGNFLKAVTRVESLRAGLEELEIRRLYTRQHARLYGDVIRLLVKEGEIEEALFYLERFRARTFLETLLAHPPVKIKKDNPLLIEEQELFAEIHFLNQQIRQISRPAQARTQFGSLSVISEETDCCQSHQLFELKQELESAKSRYEEMWLRIQAAQPDYVRLKSLNVEELRTLMTRARNLLDEEVALIEYFLDEETLRIWVITREHLTYQEIPVGQKVIIKEVLAFRSFLDQFISQPEHAESDFVAPLKDLHEILIAPIQGALKGKKILGIIPHQVLHFLPFGALKNQRYLIQDYAIFYLPSLSLLPLLREKALENGQRNLARDLLAIGNTTGDLPGAEVEVESLTKVFSQASLYVGPEATEERFMNLSPLYRILHLATHGVYDKKRPLLSYLELASPTGDGKLYVSKILDLTLGASLVTLSGCETSLPQNLDSQEIETLVSGDEILSLNRAFIYAGASAVLSSLWKVSDLVTPTLMHSFYINLKTHTKAEALRRASLAVMNQRIVYGRRKPKELSLSHPFFWAPFVLVGDWK